MCKVTEKLDELNKAINENNIKSIQRSSNLKDEIKKDNEIARADFKESISRLHNRIEDNVKEVRDDFKKDMETLIATITAKNETQDSVTLRLEDKMIDNNKTIGESQDKKNETQDSAINTISTDLKDFKTSHNKMSLSGLFVIGSTIIGFLVMILFKVEPFK